MYISLLKATIIPVWSKTKGTVKRVEEGRGREGGREALAYPEILFGGGQIMQRVNFMNYIYIIIDIYMLASICQIKQRVNCINFICIYIN